MAGRAHAQEEGSRAALRLEVHAPACLSIESVREAVAARLGYDPFVADAEGALVVEAERRGTGWWVQLRLARGARTLGERELETASRACEPFLLDVALAASVALEAYVRDIEPDEAPASSPASLPHPSEPPQPTPTLPSAPPPPAVRLVLGGGLLGAWGTSPDLTGGLLLWGHARWTHVSLGLEARVDLPRSLPAGTGAIEAFVAFSTAAGCVHLAPAAACALAGGGVLRAEGLDLMDAARITAPYAVAGGSIQVRIELVPSLALLVRFDVLATLTRVVLRVDGAPAWSTEPLSLSLAVGIEWAA